MDATVVLLLVGFILFVLAFIFTAAQVSAGRVHLVAAGLACWILAELIERWPK